MIDYVELFCLITFTDDEQMFVVPHHEIDEPEMAEVCIPYKKDGVTYAITCYITNYPNWQPVPGEMILLKGMAENLHHVLTAGKP
jgi:hypothetical protein